MNAENNKKNRMLPWLPLLVVCFAQIGTSGDNSVLSISINEFILKLNATMDQVQLSNIVYSLLAGALMVFGGMFGIAKGFKKVFMLGAALCSFGEAFAVIAPNMNMLIWVARSLTGFGAALMIPSVLGIIISLYNGKERVVAFGGVGAATGIASIVMPISAGVIMDLSGYKIAFLIMFGWFVLVFIAAWKLIPNIKPAKIRIDSLATVLSFIGLSAFIIGFFKISEWGLIQPISAPFTIMGLSPSLPMVFFGIIVIAFTLFIEKKIEIKYHSALIPQSFIQTRQVRGGLYVTGLIFVIFGGVFFMIPSWMMVVANRSSTEVGITMASMAAPMIILSLSIPKKFSYWSPRMVVLISSAIACLGTIFMICSLKADGFDSALMYCGLVLLGCAQGGYASQSAMIVASALNPRDAAQSGGIQCSVRNIWQAAGVAIMGAVLLFSSTALYKSAIEKSDVSFIVKHYVKKTPVHSFMSNKLLFKKLSQIGVSETEVEDALVVYKKVRVKSAQYAFLSLTLLILLHIPGFMGIPTQGWTRKQ